VVAGEGERETMPEAMEGLPMERKTVSRVCSIFRKDRVRSSCFLKMDENGKDGKEREQTLRNVFLCLTLQRCIDDFRLDNVYKGDLVLRLHISF
jgi:hypothetical protein